MTVTYGSRFTVNASDGPRTVTYTNYSARIMIFGRYIGTHFCVVPAVRCVVSTARRSAARSLPVGSKVYWKLEEQEWLHQPVLVLLVLYYTTCSTRALVPAPVVSTSTTITSTSSTTCSTVLVPVLVPALPANTTTGSSYIYRWHHKSTTVQLANTAQYYSGH
jgi:hypothetical protein